MNGYEINGNISCSCCFSYSPLFLDGQFVYPLPSQLLVKEVQVQFLALVLRVPDGIRVERAPRQHRGHPIPNDAAKDVGEGFIHSCGIRKIYFYERAALRARSSMDGN